MDISGLKLPNRINAANAFGGPFLAIKTVNTLLNINIQQYCSVDFSGLEKRLDMVGGVSLEITRAEVNIVKARLQNGVAVLNVNNRWNILEPTAWTACSDVTSDNESSE